MGAISSNGTSRSKAKNRRDGIDPLLVGQANNDNDQQTYGHAPFHALWRPGSTPATAAMALRRHSQANFRIYLLAIVALAIAILLLWLFLLSPVLFQSDSTQMFTPETTTPATTLTTTVTSTIPTKAFTPTQRRPTTIKAKTAKIQRPYKLPKDSSSTEKTIRWMTTTLPTTTTPGSTITSTPSTTTTPMTTQQESTTEEIQITVDEDEDEIMGSEAVVFEKIELPGDVQMKSSTKSDGGIVLAKHEQGVRQGLVRVPPTERTWPEKWSPPRLAPKLGYRPPVFTTAIQPSTARPFSTVKITTTQKPPESSSSGETVDDDQEDLFWMRDRTTDQRTALQPSRPTLVEKPVMAIQSGYDQEKERWQERVFPPSQNPWQNKGQRKQGLPFHSPSGDSELDELVDSIDSGATSTSTTRQPQTTWVGIRDRGGIRPVQIPFEFGQPRDQQGRHSWIMPTRQRTETNGNIEPVWRRRPPGENEYRKSEQEQEGDRLKEHSSKMSYIPPPAKISKEITRKRRNAPTMVTALLDIGRGEWQQFTRHFDQYIGYLENMLLSLQNNFVIYCERSVVDELVKLGAKIDWNRLQIVEIKLSDLPFYHERHVISRILESEQEGWSKDWDAMKTHPEAMYADYNILVNSKPYLLHNATSIARFEPPENDEESFFVWVDAGYGHGSQNVFPRGVWTPKLTPGKITLVQLTHNERAERYDLKMIYRKKKSVVSGGFMAGDRAIIRRFYTFFLKTFYHMLDNKKVDDDQTTILMTIKNYTSTFNLINGGWFDGFKLLPSQ